LELLAGGVIHVNALSSSSGNAGRVTLEVGRLHVSGEGSGIYASAFGGGGAGSIDVAASKSVFLSGTGGERLSLTQVLSPAGQQTLTGLLAATVDRAGAKAPAEGGGQGSIRVEAPDVTVTEGAIVATSSLGPKDGGAIRVRGDRITLSNGGLVDSSAALAGAAGSVELEASESITVTGRNAFGDGARVASGTIGPGAAGAVSLSAPSIRIDDGGAVATTTLPSNLGTAGAGPAGRIELDAAKLLVGAEGQIDSSSLTPGAAGSVSLRASESIAITGPGSRVASRAGAQGAGGSISLSAPEITISDGGEISSESSPGLGSVGDIFTSFLAETIPDTSIPLIAAPPKEATGEAGQVVIEAADALRLRGGVLTSEAESARAGGVEIRAGSLVDLFDSTIQTSSATDDGGNIRIDPEFVVLNHSTLRADATGEAGGDGGNIAIEGEWIFASPDSVLSASSRSGVQGTVVVRAPDANLSGDLTALPESFVDASELFKTACASRGAERVGSFLVEERAGVSAGPEELPRPVHARREVFEGAPDIGEAVGRAEAAEQRGDFESAVRSWREVAQRPGEDAEANVKTEATLRLSQAYSAAGDYRLALKSLSDLREEAQARGLATRARVRARMGATEPALALMDEALERARSEHADPLLAFLLFERGSLLLAMHRFGEARTSFAEAERLSTSLAADELRALLRAGQAALALETGEAEARAQLASAASEVRALHASHTQAFTLIYLGLSHERLGAARDSRRAHAAGLYREAAEIADSIDADRASSYAWGELGRLYEQDRRYNEALELTSRALAAAARARAPESLYLWQWQTGRIQMERLEIDRALAALRAASRSLREPPAPEGGGDRRFRPARGLAARGARHTRGLQGHRAPGLLRGRVCGFGAQGCAGLASGHGRDLPRSPSRSYRADREWAEGARARRGSGGIRAAQPRGPALPAAA
jgi:tetratricopeptide (TPR) repeat protein